MGARGPKPQPTALKVLRGNPGKRPLNRKEPKIAPATADELRPAAGAKLRPDERVIWSWIVKQGTAARVLTGADVLAIEAATKAVAEYRRWVDLVEADGRIVTFRNDKGAVISVFPHPGVNQAHKWLAQARGALAELGLSPAARSRVEALEAADGNQGAGSWREALLRG